MLGTITFWKVSPWSSATSNPNNSIQNCPVALLGATLFSGIFRREVVDGIVFWTKNPFPMLNRLDELKEYMYHFQFTITAYGNDVEKNLPSKKEVIIPTFQKLSKMLGSERVIWRYDPIFLSEKYSVECHRKTFEYIARRQGYTKKCVISFLDLYRNTRNNTKSLEIRPLESKK